LREVDFDYFKFGIIPSVQPTTSAICIGLKTDWEKKGKMPMLIKNCFKKAGDIALGTDFPVEEVNPMLTFMLQ
jgi:predicted amidohydrolase YtcJ